MKLGIKLERAILEAVMAWLDALWVPACDRDSAVISRVAYEKRPRAWVLLNFDRTSCQYTGVDLRYGKEFKK